MAIKAGNVPPQVLVLAAIASVQFGSAFADKIFGEVGPAGVAFLRVIFAAVILTAAVRPRLRGRTRRELVGVVGYGLALAGMNWSFYEGLDRLPLGVAVTIEFTGPLAVAVAGSRRPLDGLWVLLAGGGVVLLATRGGSDGIQPLGIVFVLIAAGCWAAYILLAKQVGASFASLDALAIGMLVGTVLVAPAGIVSGGSALLDPGVLGACLGVAVLSSIIPYSLELVALRRLATAVFGLLMSLEPAMAALAGVLLLGEHPSLPMVIALVMVIAASAGSSLTAPAEPASPPELGGGQLAADPAPALARTSTSRRRRRKATARR